MYPWELNNSMCLHGNNFDHYKIGNNLGIEKFSYKDPTGETINEKEYIKDHGVYTVKDTPFCAYIFIFIAFFNGPFCLSAFT